MQNELQQIAVKKIDRFLAKSGMSERKLSLETSRDHKLIKRIREGRATLRSAGRVLQFIAEHS